MPYTRTTAFRFVDLLVLVVAGFWKTCFSEFFQGMDRAHHFRDQGFRISIKNDTRRSRVP